MGRLLAFATVALALGFCSAPPASALEGDYEAAVTSVPVKLTGRVSSQDARPGDRFAFDTTSSVQLDGQFLPSGTHGHGVVTAARAARGPQPGLLTLEARSLDLPDGAKPIAVGLAPGQLATVLTGDRRSFPAPGPGAAPILLGGNRTTNIVYEKGTAFTVVAPPPATPAPAASGGAG